MVQRQYVLIAMDGTDLTIVRHRCGRGFRYEYLSGRPVKCERTLKRIENLVVPPNWQKVMLSRNATSDLQAVGEDNKGRKQYIYHKNWHKRRQKEKFEKLREFGDQLPEFRQFCRDKIKDEGWNRDKTLSLICLLLDHTGLRAGNRVYSETNATFGITTLRRRHLEREGDIVHLRFTGKHSKPRDVEVIDSELADLVGQSAEQPGYALFRFLDDSRKWHDVSSCDVNEYIHENLGESFSCKDFRTWGASRYALTSLPEIGNELLRNSRKRWDTTLVKKVAKMLGNTPSVCRQYYLHPKLFSELKEENRRTIVLNEIKQIMDGKTNYDNRILKVEARMQQIISS